MRKLGDFGWSIASLIISVPVLGQTLPGDASLDSSSQIVVTAQRKRENLQDVPIAVSAFDQDRLAAQHLDTGPELLLAVPNITAAKGYFGGFNFQIRGVGTQLGTPAADSGVAIHLNNEPLTSSRFFEADLYDVEQVEVLRGPQGTLYGRNATGGVVNILTARPAGSFEGFTTLEGGNYGSFRAKGAVNVPLTDTLALRTAGSYLRRSGFGENTYTGKSVNGRDVYSTRLTLGWKPDPSLTANLMWQHFNEDDDRLRSGAVLCTKDEGPTNVGGSAVTDPIVRGYLSQGCANASLYDNAHQAPNSLGTLFGILPQVFGITHGDTNAGVRTSTNLQDTSSIFNPRYEARNDIVQLSVDWNLGSSLALSSLSSYSYDRVENIGDFFGFIPSVPFGNSLFTPGGIFVDPQIGSFDRLAGITRFTQPSSQLAQELRLQSNFSGPFNFALGANYLRYTSTTTNYIASNVLTLAAQALNGAVPCPLGSTTCVYIDPNPGFGDQGHNNYYNHVPFRLNSEAVFGEAYYNITSDLELTAGARLTHDEKRQVNLPLQLLQHGSGLVIGDPPSVGSEFTEPTGRIGLDLTLHPGWGRSRVYAFYSRGYKAGGPNTPRAATSGLVAGTFEPEFVNSVEIGTKNTFFGGKLTANITAFHYDYSNYQVEEIVSQTEVVQNVAAKIIGAEFESTWRPIPPLQFDISAGYLHTRLGDTSAIDPLNITAGNPDLTLVKNSGGGNCAVPTTALADLLPIIQQSPGAPTVPGVSGNSAALLAACTGAFAALGVTPTAGQKTHIDGNWMPNAPRYTMSVGAEYTARVKNDWQATLRGDFYAQGRSYARIYNTAIDRLESWTNVNASLTFRNDPYGLQVQLFVKNAFDKQPIVNIFLYDTITGLYAQGITNEPRLWGANIIKRF